MNKTNMYKAVGMFWSYFMEVLKLCFLKTMLLEKKKIRERQKAKEEAEKRKEKEEFNRVE